MVARAAAVSLLLALAVLSNVAQSAYGQKVPLSCTVIMYSSYDYTSDKCVNAVINARKYCGGKRINFIPTLFWWEADTNPKTKPQVQKYCVDGGSSCQEVNSNSISTFKNSMVKCFKKAIELGFTTLEVVPHLDDANGLHWRAQLNFSPEKKYGQYSYYDAVLMPLADAIREVLSSKINVYFSMVGEMSGTVFRSARHWTPVLQKMKGVVGGSSKAALAKTRLKVGVSVNWDKLCGCYQLGEIDPVKYLKAFKKVFKKFEKAKQYNSKDVQALFNVVDFVGASYYPYNAASMTPDAFETSARLFDEELALYGVNLGALIARGKELRYHEYGMGGGKNGHTQRATEIGDLLRFPFFGVGGSYNKDNDPWELWRPESEKNDKRLLIRKFYRETLKWLSKGGGPKYKISAIYMWNSGSWDITGVHPDSTGGQGSWRDPYTQQMIKAYNDKGKVPK